jgi:hypothetical protein
LKTTTQELGWTLIVAGVSFWAYVQFAAVREGEIPPAASAALAPSALSQVAPLAASAMGPPRASGVPAPGAPAQVTPASGSPGAEDVAEATPVDRSELTDRDAEAYDELQLAQLERMRAIPGAAPLLDDVMEALREDGDDAIGLDNIPVNEHGLAELDDEAIERMVPDPEIRAKWEKLMSLVANYSRELQAQ